jgi:hypothetical protein
VCKVTSKQRSWCAPFQRQRLKLLLLPLLFIVSHDKIDEESQKHVCKHLKINPADRVAAAAAAAAATAAAIAGLTQCTPHLSCSLLWRLIRSMGNTINMHVLADEEPPTLTMSLLPLLLLLLLLSLLLLLPTNVPSTLHTVHHIP